MIPLIILALHAIHRVVFVHPQIALRLLRVLALVYWLLLGVPAVRAFQPHHKSRLFPASNPGMPRCCTQIHDEFKPSYASVLVYGRDPCALEQAVHDAESKQRITSCFTAWCSRCSQTYLLTTDLDSFPSPSAHHTHQLVLLSVLRDSGALVPSEPV